MSKRVMSGRARARAWLLLGVLVGLGVAAGVATALDVLPGAQSQKHSAGSR